MVYLLVSLLKLGLVNDSMSEKVRKEPYFSLNIGPIREPTHRSFRMNFLTCIEFNTTPNFSRIARLLWL